MKGEQKIKKQEPKGESVFKSITDAPEGDVTAGLGMDTTPMFLQQQKQQEEFIRQQQQQQVGIKKKIQRRNHINVCKIRLKSWTVDLMSG